MYNPINVRERHQPIQRYLSSLVVIITKKDGSWHIFPYYRHLNKMTIKYKFPIPIIVDELLYEFHGSIFFTKLHLHLEYHQIRMTKETLSK
jgi:hypothetical protein